MRIGKSFALIIIILLSVSCTTSIKRSRIVTETPLYQQEIEGLMQTYVAAINSQNWISASNQHYIARCSTDSLSAKAKFFKYSYDGRLNSKLALESLDFQTRKITKVPIVLVGKDYWAGLKDWIANVMYEKAGNINKKDLDLMPIVDSAEEAVAIICNFYKGKDSGELSPNFELK